MKTVLVSPIALLPCHGRHRSHHLALFAQSGIPFLPPDASMLPTLTLLSVSQLYFKNALPHVPISIDAFCVLLLLA
jgi:hypothetical protein